MRAGRSAVAAAAALAAAALAGWHLLGGEGGVPPPSPGTPPAAPAPAPPPPPPLPPAEVPAAPARAPAEAEGRDRGGEDPGEGPRTPRAPLAGVVLDARNGAAIPGARVTVIHGGSRAGAGLLVAGAEESPLGTAVTGDGGRFRVEGIPAGEIVTVRAAREGFTAASESLILQEGATGDREVTLRLDRAGALRGVVRFADGRPAPGSRVYVLPADAADMAANPDAVRSGGGRTIRALRVPVGEDGSYRVDGLDLEASWVALAILDGYGRSATAEGIVPTEEDPEAVRDLTLVRAGRLEVRVLRPDGTPAPGGKAMLWGEGFPAVLGREGDGPFAAPVEATGPHRLHVDVPGFLPERREIDLVAGEDRTVEVTLRAGLVLAGTMVDDAGNPVADQEFVVDRHWKDEGRPPSEGRARTDAEGRFRLEGLGEGPHRIILVLGAFSLPEDFRVEVPDAEARIVVRRRARAAARLETPEGSPVPEKGMMWVHREVEGGISGSSCALEIEGDRLLSRPFDPGPVRLALHFAGFLPVEREVEADPGGTVDLGTIALDPGAVLEGRVVDPQGRPVAGAEISAGEIWTPTHRVATTGADGAFRLPHLAPEGNELEVSAGGFLPWAGTAGAPAPAGFRIVLRRGGLLRGRVRGADGAPAAGLEVAFSPAGRGEEGGGGDGTGGPGPSVPDESAETDHAGAFEVRLPPGTWTVVVHGPGGEPLLERGVALEEGAAVDLPLDLPAR